MRYTNRFVLLIACALLFYGVAAASDQITFGSTASNIGDRVWYDENCNGTQEEGEPGVADVMVKLYRCTCDSCTGDCTCEGEFVAQTTTDESGYYYFKDFDHDTYFVQFVAPPGYNFTERDVGVYDLNDSDADPKTGRTECFELTEEDSYVYGWDAGLCSEVFAASVGDFVWNDLDCDGCQDEGEPGLEGVFVKLYECTEGGSKWIATTVTDEYGHYSFDNVPGGDYRIKFVAPDGYYFTDPDNCSDDAIDSDAVSNGVTDCIIKINEDGQCIDTIDAGLCMIPVDEDDCVVEEDEDDACVRSPGYWKNHPGAWPVDEITIGGVEYSKDEAIANMTLPVRGDKTITMFKALVAAKLNVVVGADDSCINDTIEDADEWMDENGPVGSNVRASSDAWKEGECLYLKLDAYNNGELCGSDCDDSDCESDEDCEYDEDDDREEDCEYDEDDDREEVKEKKDNADKNDKKDNKDKKEKNDKKDKKDVKDKNNNKGGKNK